MSNLESVIENEAKKIVGIPRRDLATKVMKGISIEVVEGSDNV